MPKIKKLREKSKESEKLRNFAFILYPESAKSDWKRILVDLHQPVFWILHDKDHVIDEKTGELVPKKLHYHVMIMFENQRHVNTAIKIARMCGSNEHVEKLKSKKAYARYLCHLDELEKYKYNFEEVRCLGGADYNKIACTESEIEVQVDGKLAEIISFCQNNKIFAYCRLIDYCVKERRDWLRILRKTGSGNLVREYIKSNCWASEREG